MAKRPWNGSRRHHEDIWIVPFSRKIRLLPHTKTVLLIDDNQTKAKAYSTPS